jgi:hypothetical protein
MAGPPPILFGAVEKLALVHQTKDCQDCLLAMSRRSLRDFGGRQPRRQIVQEWKQTAIVKQHFGPGAGSLEGYCFLFDPRERAWRKPKRPFERAFWRGPRRRPQGNARYKPSAPTAQASREQPQAIQAKEQRGATLFVVPVKIAFYWLVKAIIDIRIAAVRRCKKFEQLELSGLKPNLTRRRVNESTPVSRTDLYVRRERISPQCRTGGHRRQAVRIGSEC